MEHRNDRKDRILLGDSDPERVGSGDTERVQDRRPVRVHDALRHAGGAARVTHRRRLVLIQVGLDPLVRIRRGEQLLVGVFDDEHVLDLRLVAELVDERHQARVDDQRAVACMRRDVADVVGVESDIERVQHEAAAGNAEVGLEVLVVVPAQRRDAVTALEAELSERHCKLLRAARHVCVGVAVERLVGQARDDLLVAEVRLRAPKQGRDRQLEVHHQAVHRSSF